MKKIYKYLLLTMLTMGTLFYSCETTELELITSPNALSPELADPEFMLNRIQMEFVRTITIFNNESADLARIDYMFGRNYFSNLGQTTLNGVWRNLYADMFPDIAAIEALHSSDNDLSLHLGISKTLQAYLLMQMVDFLGDIVYTQANNPVEFPNPELDDDQAVYTSALGLLDQAAGFLNNSSGSQIPLDLFYGNDTSKWLKLVNTLRMRANLTVGNYAAVLSQSNVIDDTADDFEFSYGTNELQPDTRHPDYEADYRADGANIYQSSWLVSLMVGPAGDEFAAFGLEDTTDPRRRYYFFRQNWRTPNNYGLLEDLLGLFGPVGDILVFSTGGDGQTLQCSIQDTPINLQFTPDEDIWCGLYLGYWIRHHGVDEGIPPDNFLRTAVGVYPAGGSFDGREDAFPYIGESISASFGQSVGLGKGGGGAGIEPIILASYVDFWRAEANLMLGNTAAASSNIEDGMTKSIAKVMSFGALDGSANMAEVPDATRVSGFIQSIIDQFDAADLTTAVDGTGFPVDKDKMDILGEQFFVAMFGGGGDAFNFIRRTGYPRTLSRNIEPNPGLFPRTFLYPGDEIGANPNVQQRTDLNTRVFWDQGVINPAN